MTIAAIRALLQSPEGDGTGGTPTPAPAAPVAPVMTDAGALDTASGSNDVERVLEALRKERQDRKQAEAERARRSEEPHV